MFIGRQRELSKLTELYSTDKFQFPVIYGRRRVGKTALINEFIKDKDTIFFTGMESSVKQNLENFSQSIFAYTDPDRAGSVFPSFQAALEYVFQLAAKKCIVLVIDEYPYLAKSAKSFASTLQLLIDKHKDDSKLFLILCGSSMSFMENHVLAYRAPLYGRRTAQIKVLPFDFFESRRYFQHFSDMDMAAVYGIVGGTPQYLLQMDDRLSVEENIKRTLLDPTGPLFEEPGNLLKQEVREPAIYNAIIAAVAGGSTRLVEISDRAGEESSACSAYLKNLVSLGIIKKETPFGEITPRKTLYVIDDNLFRFWYRFIPENMATIQRGLPEIACQRIMPDLSAFMGPVFEEICKQYLWELRRRGSSPVDFTDLGRWWGNDPQQKCEEEIDIMGDDKAGAALFGECKWTNEKVDVGVLDTLIRRSRLFRYSKTHLCLFAKTGFTQGCKKRAAELGNVSLFSFAEMME